MKFTVARDVLAEAVSWTARALPVRPASPILAGVRIKAEGDELTLSSFDYEVSANSHIPATVDEAGEVQPGGGVEPVGQPGRGNAPGPDGGAEDDGDGGLPLVVPARGPRHRPVPVGGPRHELVPVADPSPARQGDPGVGRGEEDARAERAGARERGAPEQEAAGGCGGGRDAVHRASSLVQDRSRTGRASRAGQDDADSAL